MPNGNATKLHQSIALFNAGAVFLTQVIWIADSAPALLLRELILAPALAMTLFGLMNVGVELRTRVYTIALIVMAPMALVGLVLGWGVFYGFAAAAVGAGLVFETERAKTKAQIQAERWQRKYGRRRGW